MALQNTVDDDTEDLCFHPLRVKAKGKGKQCIFCDSQAGQFLRCGYKKNGKLSCNKYFHEECMKNYHTLEFDTENMKRLLSASSFVCPSHACDTCLMARRKNSAIEGNLVECMDCYRSFHEKCAPAGVRIIEVRVDNKAVRFTRCHTHVFNRFPAGAKLRYCYSCEELFKGKEATKSCATCIRSIHTKCIKRGFKNVPDGLKTKFGDDAFFCDPCVCGGVITPQTKAAVFFQNFFYPGTAVSVDDVPAKCIKSDPLKKHYGEAGYIPIKWGGCDNMYNLVHANRIVRIWPNSRKFFKGSKDPDYIKSWDEFEKDCDVPLPDEVKKTRKVAKHKNIETSVYHKPSMKKDVTMGEEFDEDDLMCQCKGKAKAGEKHCITTACLNWVTEAECPPACGDRCQNRGIQLGKYNPKTEVKMTEKKGNGVFATEKIKKNEFIAEYAGEIIGPEEKEKRTKEMIDLRNHEETHYMMELSKGRFVDCKIKGNRARFINHSCNPNTSVHTTKIPMLIGKRYYLDDRIRIVANRDIEEGEELTFNYRMESHGKDVDIPPCYCGEANCTGILGEDKENKNTKATVARKKKGGRGVLASSNASNKRKSPTSSPVPSKKSRSTKKEPTKTTTKTTSSKAKVPPKGRRSNSLPI